MFEVTAICCSSLYNSADLLLTSMQFMVIYIECQSLANI